MRRQRHEGRRQCCFVEALQSFSAAISRLDFYEYFAARNYWNGRLALLRRALRRLGGVVEDQGHYASSTVLLVAVMYRAVARQLRCRAAGLCHEAYQRSPAFALDA